jgi:hypothetical protein
VVQRQCDRGKYTDNSDKNHCYHLDKAELNAHAEVFGRRHNRPKAWFPKNFHVLLPLASKYSEPLPNISRLLHIDIHPVLLQ